MLTFDDGYGGHYKYIYPLLKINGYPAVFSICTSGVGNNTSRSHVSWEQLKNMAADPLVTIASHSFTHPPDLRALTEAYKGDSLVGYIPRPVPHVVALLPTVPDNDSACLLTTDHS